MAGASTDLHERVDPLSAGAVERTEQPITQVERESENDSADPDQTD